MVELFGAIMGLIYPILFLVTAILMLARVTAGNIVLIITAIFALIWALLEVVAVFMYK
jgi:glucose dehydrogenase